MARPLGAFRSLNHCTISKRLGCRAEGSTLLSHIYTFIRQESGIWSRTVTWGGFSWLADPPARVLGWVTWTVNRPWVKQIILTCCVAISHMPGSRWGLARPWLRRSAVGQNIKWYCCEYAQRGKGRRKLYQLHGRSLLRIGCHMTIDSWYGNIRPRDLWSLDRTLYGSRRFSTSYMYI
jgi:hypothetical protein